MISALVVPWVAMLFQQSERNNYIGFIGQLSARQFDALLSLSPADHADCIHTIGSLIAKTIGEVPVEVLVERQALFGILSTRTVAMWDARRRVGDPNYADDKLQWRTDHLIDYICAGFTAPMAKQPDES